MRKIALLLLLASACTGDGGGGGGGGDILDQLREVPGLTVTEVDTQQPGYRFFEMTFIQPADHADPGGATFAQSMTLLHRDIDAPVIFSTQGYAISGTDNRTELTALLGANELEVEHRFF